MGRPPELSVVCKSCGSEVSPYVTECPYCGQRLRKRAPKLERHGDEVAPKRSLRGRLGRLGGGVRVPGVAAAGRPYATAAAIAAAAAAVLVERAVGAGVTVLDLGAIAGPVGAEWWRYLAAPFVYSDLGYLFAAGVALAVFGGALERRFGSVATLSLLVACGGLGMLAAEGLEPALGDDLFLAAGGNGMALGALATWLVIQRRESRGGGGDADLIGAAAIAAVLLALPAVEEWANLWAGLGGAAVGALAGLAATAGRAPPA